MTETTDQQHRSVVPIVPNPPRVVLITGGTRGLGKAMGLEFAKAGETVYLTQRWGSVDDEDLTAEFCAQGLAAPRIIESDASSADETRTLMQTIEAEAGALGGCSDGLG